MSQGVGDAKHLKGKNPKEGAIQYVRLEFNAKKYRWLMNRRKHLGGEGVSPTELHTF